MLILKPLSIDWSVAGAKIPAVAFTAPAGLPPVDSHIVRLLGPCFKTGRREPFSHRLCVREMPKSPGSLDCGKPSRDLQGAKDIATRHERNSPQMSSAKAIHSPEDELP